MNLVSLQFDEGNPYIVSVSMTIEEAVAIATLFGKLNGHGLRKLGLPDDGEGPYGCLVGDVINHYWEGGLADIGPPKFDLATLNDAANPQEAGHEDWWCTRHRRAVDYEPDDPCAPTDRPCSGVYLLPPYRANPQVQNGDDR